MGGTQVGRGGGGLHFLGMGVQSNRWGVTSVRPWSNLFVEILTEGDVNTEAGSVFQHLTILAVKAHHLICQYCHLKYQLMKIILTHLYNYINNTYIIYNIIFIGKWMQVLPTLIIHQEWKRMLAKRKLLMTQLLKNTITHYYEIL